MIYAASHPQHIPSLILMSSIVSLGGVVRAFREAGLHRFSEPERHKVRYGSKPTRAAANLERDI